MRARTRALLRRKPHRTYIYVYVYKAVDLVMNARNAARRRLEMYSAAGNVIGRNRNANAIITVLARARADDDNGGGNGGG